MRIYRSFLGVLFTLGVNVYDLVQRASRDDDDGTYYYYVQSVDRPVSKSYGNRSIAVRPSVVLLRVRTIERIKQH